MTNERASIMMALALTLAVLCACSEGPKPAPESEAVPPVSSAAPAPRLAAAPLARPAPDSGSVPARATADPLWITVPVALRLPGLTSVQTAPSWEARVAALPPPDQAYLEEVRERYFGTLAFQDEAEQRELVRQGFPMPEEWLAARELPTSELERLADAGSVKARMFYIDRVSQEIGPRQARGDGLDPSLPDERALLGRIGRASAMTSELLRRSRSPFAAYVVGRFLSAMSHGNPPEPFAASFLMADRLGHRRAMELQKQFLTAHPGTDASAIMTHYSALRSAFERR